MNKITAPPQSAKHYPVGTIAAFTLFVLVLVYDVITICGFLSLASPAAPIADPYFLLMELLTIILSLLMVVLFAALHRSAPLQRKTQSLAALSFMILMAGTTTVVHFVILTVGRAMDTEALNRFSWLLSFKWPSVSYALDILAWDLFFPLSMLFAAAVFRKGSRRERIISVLMLAGAIVSLAGLLGIPFNNMQLRNIGIIGYAVISPFAFLVLGFNFRKAQQ